MSEVATPNVARKHGCDEQREANASAIVDYWGGEWMIQVQRDGCWHTIRFCPFCGIKLDKKD